MPTKEEYTAKLAEVRRRYVKLSLYRLLIIVPIHVATGFVVWGSFAATFIWTLGVFISLYGMVQDALTIWYMKSEEQRVR